MFFVMSGENPQEMSIATSSQGRLAVFDSEKQAFDYLSVRNSNRLHKLPTNTDDPATFWNSKHEYKLYLPWSPSVREDFPVLGETYDMVVFTDVSSLFSTMQASVEYSMTHEGMTRGGLWWIKAITPMLISFVEAGKLVSQISPENNGGRFLPPNIVAALSMCFALPSGIPLPPTLEAPDTPPAPDEEREATAEEGEAPAEEGAEAVEEVEVGAGDGDAQQPAEEGPPADVL